MSHTRIKLWIETCMRLYMYMTCADGRSMTIVSILVQGGWLVNNGGRLLYHTLHERTSEGGG